MTDIIMIPKDEAEKKEFVKSLLERVFTHLEEVSQKSTAPEKLYFSGEFDSNQTEFEQMSNHLEIGVQANDKPVGLILLGFLRIIIDKHPNLIWFRLED